MYDTKFSDFNIVKSTPYRRDPMKDLAEACRKVGHQVLLLLFDRRLAQSRLAGEVFAEGLSRPAKSGRPTCPKYADYMRNQVHELLTGYGPIGIIWFDGGGAFGSSDRVQLLKGDEMVKMIHEIQPDCLINNRRRRRQRLRHARTIHSGRRCEEPFEVCMTLNGHWGYNKADQNWKICLHAGPQPHRHRLQGRQLSAERRPDRRRSDSRP